MLQETPISERHACALVGLARDSWRCPPQRAQADRQMSQKIVELAHERRRFGYRRIGDLIRAEGTVVNDKRVYRLYRLADLAAPVASGSSSSECRCTDARRSTRCGASTSSATA